MVNERIINGKIETYNQGVCFKIKDFFVNRYLSNDLTDELLICLAAELTPLTCEGFLRGGVTPELMADVEAHLKVADRIVVARDSNLQPVAFITTSMHPFDTNTGRGLMYHLEGIIVKPDFQGSGLSKALVVDDIRNSGATHLGFHTQNARMRAFGAKVAYLNETDALAYGHVIDTHAQRGLVDVNRYGGASLYGDTARFSSIAIQDINWRLGDAAVCIGPIREEILR